MLGYSRMPGKLKILVDGGASRDQRQSTMGHAPNARRLSSINTVCTRHQLDDTMSRHTPRSIVSSDKFQLSNRGFLLHVPSVGGDTRQWRWRLALAW